MITDDLREIIEAEITARLEALERKGIIVPFCQFHHREHVQAGDEGEFCAECAADGGSGELCNLGCDSEAIEIADAIAKKSHDAPRAMVPQPDPVTAPVTDGVPLCKCGKPVYTLGKCEDCNSADVQDLIHDGDYQ